MSNKQSSSVDWLFEELFNSFEKFNNGEFSFAEYMAHNLKLRKQAKEKHKKEIIKAFDEGQEYEYQYHINSTPKFDSETYYKETFGNNDD